MRKKSALKIQLAEVQVRHGERIYQLYDAISQTLLSERTFAAVIDGSGYAGYNCFEHKTVLDIEELPVAVTYSDILDWLMTITSDQFTFVSDSAWTLAFTAITDDGNESDIIYYWNYICQK